MTGLRGRPLPETPPHRVEGYDRARAAGLLPVVPVEPPRLLPGPTAGAVSRRFVLWTICAVFGMVFGLLIVSKTGIPEHVMALLGAPVMLAVGFTVLRKQGRVGDRAVEEFNAGYTTLVLTFGGFWFGANRRWQGAGHRTPWDYSGTWVYSEDGTRIVSAPDGRTVSPGFYPSPNKRGSLELWTGIAWSGNYRPDPSSTL
jgi:hypothetical protein